MTLVGEQGEEETGEVSLHRLKLGAQERTDMVVRARNPRGGMLVCRTPGGVMPGFW